jgi:hypothetical protein
LSPLKNKRGTNISLQATFPADRNKLPFFPVYQSTGCGTPGNLEEEIMKLRIATAALMVATFSLPAFAADEFYVVQDVKTKKCTIVDKRPTDTSMTVVSPSGTIYKSRTEAESGMKTVKVCTSN